MMTAAASSTAAQALRLAVLGWNCASHTDYDPVPAAGPAAEAPGCIDAATASCWLLPDRAAPAGTLLAHLQTGHANSCRQQLQQIDGSRCRLEKRTKLVQFLQVKRLHSLFQRAMSHCNLGAGESTEHFSCVTHECPAHISCPNTRHNSSALFSALLPCQTLLPQD